MAFDAAKESKVKKKKKNKHVMYSEILTPTLKSIIDCHSGCIAKNEEVRHCNVNEMESEIDGRLDAIAERTKLIRLHYNKNKEKILLIGTEQQICDAKMLIKFLCVLHENYPIKQYLY
eukprot:375066_1